MSSWRSAAHMRFNLGTTEKTLKHLVKQKQDKVEEIKKKTGYYSTRDLLEKYDEALRKGVRAFCLLRLVLLSAQCF